RAGRGVAVAEAVEEGVDPALDAEGDAAGEGGLAVGGADAAALAEEAAVEVDGGDGHLAGVEELLLLREELLQDGPPALRLVEGVGADGDGEPEPQPFAEPHDPGLAVQEVLLHCLAAADADDLPHGEAVQPPQVVVALLV